jgi:serine protease AprX
MASGKMFWIVLLVALVPLRGATQENRYMVFFKDKEGIAQTIDRPIEFLSEKAIQRRLRQNLSVTTDDLPVQKA